MGQIIAANVSGSGSLSLGGLVNVTEVAAKIETLATETTVAGVSPVRRVRRQAWYGIGITPDGGPLVGVVVITWQKFVEMECEDTIPLGHALAPADKLYWEVFDGGEMTFEVDW